MIFGIELDPLENAVFTVLRGDAKVPPAVRKEAMDYINGFQRSGDRWVYCCQQFIQRSRFPEALLQNKLQNPEVFDPCHAVNNVNDWLLEVRYWYLHEILETVWHITPNDRRIIREMISVYVGDILPWRASAFCNYMVQCNDSKMDKCFPSADAFTVTTAMAVLLLRCLLLDYPDNWPEAVRWLTLDVIRENSNRWASCSKDKNVSNVLRITIQQQYLALVQFFCSVWEAFDEDVVQHPSGSVSSRRNMRVKDALRDGDILVVCETLKTILQDFGVEYLAIHSQNPKYSMPDAQVVLKTLGRVITVLAKFVSWVDIQILANGPLLNLLYYFFTPSTICGPAVVKFVQALFSKRMDSGQRIVMVHKLGLLDQTLSRVTTSLYSNSEEEGPLSYMTNAYCDAPSQYLIEMAELLNTVGLQLLDSLKELRKEYDSVPGVVGNSGRQETRRVSEFEASEPAGDIRAVGGVEAAGINPFFTPITSPDMWKEMQKEAWKMLQQLFPAVTIVLAHPHPQTSQSLLPFLHEFLCSVKAFTVPELLPIPSHFKPPKYPLDHPRCPLYVPLNELSSFLENLLKLILDRVRYPLWFASQDARLSEPGDSFRAFRSDVIQSVFKPLYNLDEKTSLVFLCNTVHQLMSFARTPEAYQLHPNQSESVLCLIIAVAENYKDIAKALCAHDGLLARCLCQLFSCHLLGNVSSADLRDSITKFFGAYLPFIFNRRLHPENENYIDNVLRLLLGPNGLLTTATSDISDCENTSISSVLSLLLRFVRYDTFQIVPYALQIITALDQTGFLTVHYVASSQWICEEHSARLSQPSAFQSATKTSANSSVKNLAALAFPSKLPNALWSFDDQYCCFEIVGVLIASIAKQTTCSTPDDSILQITNRVIAPLLSFFFAHDGMEGPSSALQALVETDFIGTADLITRKLTAFNHLTKRFTKILEAVMCQLRSLGPLRSSPAEVRSAVAGLFRRLALLLSPQLLSPFVGITVCRLFDATIAAFLGTNAAESLTPSQCELPNNDAEHRARQQLVCSLDDNTWFAVSSISPKKLSPVHQFAGHQELSQLLALLNFLITTFKEQCEALFFTPFHQTDYSKLLMHLGTTVGELPSSQVSLSETNEAIGAATAAAAAFTTTASVANGHKTERVSPLTWSWRSLPLVLRVLGQCICCWQCMPAGASPEDLRVKNELQHDLFVSLTTLASFVPSLFLKLLEKTGTYDTEGVSLLGWMINGCQPESASSMQTVVSCLQTWTMLLKYLCSPTCINHSVPKSREQILFERLHFTDVIRGTTRILFLLNLEDPQHHKVVLEFCSLLCTLTTASAGPAKLDDGASVTESQNRTGTFSSIDCSAAIMNRLQHVFLSSLPSHVCSPQDAVLVFHAITIEAPSAKSAKDILSKWIVTQQMSACPPQQ